MTAPLETAERGRGARRLRLASIALVGVVAFLGLATTASAIVYARTTVTIRAQGTDLSGYVSSRSPARCAKNRRSRFTARSARRQSPRTDTRIGSDNASLNGTRYAWSTGNTGQSGKMYARAGRIRGCLADTSPTITVAPQP